MNYSIESVQMTENDQDLQNDSLDMEYGAASPTLRVLSPPYIKGKDKKGLGGRKAAFIQHQVVDFEDLKIVGSKAKPG